MTTEQHWPGKTEYFILTNPETGGRAYHAGPHGKEPALVGQEAEGAGVRGEPRSWPLLKFLWERQDRAKKFRIDSCE